MRPGIHYGFTFNIIASFHCRISVIVGLRGVNDMIAGLRGVNDMIACIRGL